MSFDPLVLADRINRRAIPNHRGCLVWQGALNSRGYGCIGVGGKSQSVHRVAYELYYGLIPEGLTIDHGCFNTRCANPLHLEAVTQSVNNERALRRRMANATRGGVRYCAEGHAIEGENAYVGSHGSLACVVCKRRDVREHARRSRAEGPRYSATGDVLKAIRKALGWRQQDVADFLGITSSGQVMVSEWERGRALIPARYLDALRAFIAVERAA